MRYIYITLMSLLILSCTKDDEVLIIEVSPENKSYIPLMADLEKISIDSFNRILDFGITGLSFHNDKLLGVNYQREDHILEFDFQKSRWIPATDEVLRNTVDRYVSVLYGKFTGAGGMAIHDNKLWVSNGYGASISALDLENNEICFEHKFEHRTQSASQGYDGITVKESFIYIAYHSHLYADDSRPLQSLLKINMNTKEVIRETSLGTDSYQIDSAHGLTFAGKHLWHARNDRLSRIDESTGDILNSYELNIARPAGITFFNDHLYIVSFNGDLYKIPMIEAFLR